MLWKSKPATERHRLDPITAMLRILVRARYYYAHARYHNYIITQLSLFNKFCFESNVSNCHALFVVSKFIRIGIADKNDNPPYFDKALYEAEVDENEDIQHTVLTVTAKDHDEC